MDVCLYRHIRIYEYNIEKGGDYRGGIVRFYQYGMVCSYLCHLVSFFGADAAAYLRSTLPYD